MTLIDRLRSLFHRADREASFERTRKTISKADEALRENDALTSEARRRIIEAHEKAEQAIRASGRG